MEKRNIFKDLLGREKLINGAIADAVYSTPYSWALVAYIDDSYHVSYHMIANTSKELIYLGSFKSHASKYQYGIRNKYKEISNHSDNT